MLFLPFCEQIAMESNLPKNFFKYNVQEIIALASDWAKFHTFGHKKNDETTSANQTPLIKCSRQNYAIKSKSDVVACANICMNLHTHVCMHMYSNAMHVSILPRGRARVALMYVH
jgi:hypothetical protein